MSRRRDEMVAEASKMDKYELADYISYGLMACGGLAVILAGVGIVKGFGAAEKKSESATEGACCTECVQDMAKFIAIVVFAPVATFIVIMVSLIVFLGKSNVGRGVVGYQEIRKGKEGPSIKTAYAEATAGKFVLAGAVVLFVFLMVVLFFTGPKGLAGTNLAPESMQSRGACTGDYKWCVACKPQLTLLLAASAGGALLAAIVGAGLTYAGEHYKKKLAMKE